MRVGDRVIIIDTDFLLANEVELALVYYFLKIQACGSVAQVTEIDICGDILVTRASKDFVHGLESVLSKVGSQGPPWLAVIELRE